MLLAKLTSKWSHAAGERQTSDGSLARVVADTRHHPVKRLSRSTVARQPHTSLRHPLTDEDFAEASTAGGVHPADRWDTGEVVHRRSTRVLGVEPLLRAAVISACIVSVSACSSDPDPAGEAPSWECITAQGSLGLNTGSPVWQARVVLDEALADPATSNKERSYFSALRKRIADLPPDDTVGTALDGVPCEL